MLQSMCLGQKIGYVGFPNNHDQVQIQSQAWMGINHPWKFGKDISRHSSIIGQTSFFKMAAWWPYWISNQTEIQSQCTLDRGD